MSDNDQSQRPKPTRARARDEFFALLDAIGPRDLEACDRLRNAAIAYADAAAREAITPPMPRFSDIEQFRDQICHEDRYDKERM